MQKNSILGCCSGFPDSKIKLFDINELLFSNNKPIEIYYIQTEH